MANCRQCGQEIGANVRFCPNCGVENPLDSRTTPPQSINSKRKSKTKLVQRMFWTVVVVAGIVYFSGHHTQNQNQTASSSNNAESASSADPGSASSVTSSSTPATAPSQPAAPTCSSDWKECKNNADLANNYVGWTNARADCEVTFENEVQYGTPKFPSFWSGEQAFGNFLGGSDYISTGIAILISRDVQIQNQFGAMVHSTVYCKYNLSTQKVLDVTVSSGN